MNVVPTLLLAGLFLFGTSASMLHAQDAIRISEFMALNNDGLDDEDGDEEDWIEIHNAGTTPVNLGGWFLTDTTNNLQKWMFPPVTLAPNGYLVVFASNKDRNVGELHTNFRLGGDGEYLGLIRPDGVTVASHFAPIYPIQAPNISYGLRGSTTEEVLLPAGAPAKAMVPLNALLEPEPGQNLVRPWTSSTLDDSGWMSGTTGVGYDYPGLVGLDVTAMRNINETVYIRIPFVVPDPSIITSLTLRMRFEDGMIAYLNGREVAWNNSPDPAVATWNSGAPANRDDATAVVPMNFNISAFIDNLQVGTNLLAIQGLNNLVASSDLLILPEVIATVTGSGVQTLRYFPIPTPGGPNNAGVNQLGPIVENEEHRPAIPTDGDALRVTARIRPALGTVSGAVLHYRVGFNAELTLPFLDDGNSGDEGAGDGVYGAIIPASASGPGAMVRWYITATDSVGGSSRLPSFVEPLDSPEYFGTVVHNPALTNPLPVLHWFIQNPSSADNDAGTRCSLFYDGEFYDNLAINLHGQSSRGFPKKSYDIDLHPGNNFKWKEGEPRADDINLLTTYPDKAHMRNMLAHETYRDADNAHHWVLPVRVQQNGAFWGTAHIVENGDEDWLVRMGINSEGALYKMYNTFTSAGDAITGAEKKTRKNESNADLSAFQAGVILTGEARRRYLYDNVDVGQVINFLAARGLTGDTDCCHKNYYFYRDSGQSGEWQMWPWDVDLSFGRRWIGSLTYWDQNLIPNTPLFIGNGNGLGTAIFSTPEIRQMYLRRVRTLMDELLKPPGTLLAEMHYEPRIDELAAALTPDALLDAAKWNSHAWGNGGTAPCCPQLLPEAVAELKNVYLPARRTQLYNGLTSGANELPGAQPPGTVINFGVIEANPSSGNQDQEFIQLVNPHNFAVDISSWVLSGAVQFKFRGGTVIPANGVLYVAANRPAWRARSAAPTGNNALFVTGDYEGRLSARGELLELTDRQGAKVASVNTPALPSQPQLNLRITELMYHPPILPGDTFDREEYEFIELKNIGASQLSLAAVKFTDGVLFNFSGSSITSLAAGQHVLVVRNLAAFTQRYGAVAAARVAGVYTGSLENAGEQLRLDDASNEKVLEFSYNNSWYPITDGRGFSLVIVNPLALFNTWGLKESWRPSGREYGSPAADDTAPSAVPAVLINEVLAHTDLPAKDTVELHNPTAAPVDVGGWYLTDDPDSPKKFRIPAGQTIPAGGYLVFDEDDFNPVPGTPPSFSFRSTGDEAFLYSGNAAGELTGYHHGYVFEASATGVPFGRHIDSQGVEHFVAMASFTPGVANSAPLVGPVILSEVHYHPPEKREGVGYVEAFDDEFIELHNITGAPVGLFDSANPANTWRIRGGVDFDFPQNITLPANGRLLVVSFNPVNNPAAAAAFRTRHGLAQGVVLVGPFGGQLGNDNDAVRLRRPDSPVVAPDPEAGLVPSILVDQLDYTDDVPWPLAADGFGPSLQRRTPVAFGNDPLNWTAATITPAAGLAAGNPPVITVQPTNRTVVAFSDVTFAVNATGDQPLRYQWTFEGDSIQGQTNSTLVLTRVSPSRQGTYRVVVLNSSGSAVSSNALLTVAIPATITQQPSSISAHLGGTAVFVVQASSSTPIRYAWRKDGNILPQATNSFLTISGVRTNDAGSYDVIVTDAVGSITSNPAQLTVLINPVITSQPASLNVTVLSTPVNISFSVTATSGTLLRYQWLFNGAPLSPTANIPSVTNSVLAINNVGLVHAGGYSVIVRDDFGQAISQMATLVVNTRAEILVQPGPQEVPEGGTASFSVAWSGSGPFLHRWRRVLPTSATLGFLAPTNGLGNLILPNGYITASPTNTVLVLTNVSLALSGSTYDIVISNGVGQAASEDGVLTVVADTDRDGLPDSWETGRAGFDVSNGADALRDDDGDGMNNAKEYFAGTDYLNNQSYLRAQIQEGGPTLLTFPATAGRSYTVQYTDGLSPIQWRNLVIVPAKAAQVVTVTDPVARPNRHYRLVTPAQP